MLNQATDARTYAAPALPSVSVCDIIQNFQVKEVLFLTATLQSFMQTQYDGFYALPQNRDMRIFSVVIFVCPSIRPSACNNSPPTGWIFMKLGIRAFIENLSRKFNFY